MTQKPHMRPGKSKDLAHGTGEVLLALLDEARDAFPSCLNCFYFAEAQQWCTRYGGHPPPRTVVYGCPGYIDAEEIPF